MNHNLIEKYIYNVVKNLPLRERVDVERELRSNIEDMLEGDYSQIHIEETLLQLGDPSLLAVEYTGQKKYLISPQNYYNYINILKLVIPIVFFVMFGISIINDTLTLSNPNFINILEIFFKSIFTAAFTAIYVTFTWVTIIFFIIDRYTKKEEFRLDKMTEVPTKTKNKIPRTDTIASIIFSSIFTVIIVLYPNMLGWYEKEAGSLVLKESLFNTDVLNNYVPFIIGLFIISMTIALVKLIYGRWNILLASLSTMYNILFTLFIINFMYSEVFNENILSYFKGHENDSLEIWNKAKMVFIIIVVIANVIESIRSFIKIKQ